MQLSENDLARLLPIVLTALSFLNFQVKGEIFAVLVCFCALYVANTKDELDKLADAEREHLNDMDRAAIKWI